MVVGYKKLIDELDKQRKDIAIFRKVALHVHSTDSYDYKGDEDENGFVEKIKGIKDLDLIAITDHMKCNLACHLSKNLVSKNKCILPGMEINISPPSPLNYKLHFLAIFPEKTTIDEIERIFPPNIKGESKRYGDETLKIDIKDFIKKVRENKGICIAAHVENQRGARKFFRKIGFDGLFLCDKDYEPIDDDIRRIERDFKDWLFTAEFDAIEVNRETDKEHYTWDSEIDGRRICIPVILSNDAHKIEDIEGIPTFIKMTEVNFNGLKQALNFPDTRIRFPCEIQPQPVPRIIGIEIEAGDEKGFFSDLKLAFSENLNCIIGPRGSGKSTIIEALRYVFGYNRSLKNIQFQGSEIHKKVVSLQSATLENCIIRVAFLESNNEKSILESAYDSKQDYTTRVYSIDGEDKEINDVEISGRFPLRFFGWSELETIGRESNRQRELLDRLIEGLGKDIEKRYELRKELEKKRNEIETLLVDLKTILRKNNGEIFRFKEYQTDFNNLNTDEVKRIFQEFDLVKAKQLIVEKIKNNIMHWIDSIKPQKDYNIFQNIDDILKSSPIETEEWWIKVTEDIKLSEICISIKNDFDKLVDKLSSLLKQVEFVYTDINQQKIIKDKEIREKVNEEAAKKVAAELRRSASDRLQRVTDLKAKYDEIYKKIEQIKIDWSSLADQLTEIQEKITEKRIERKNEIERKLNEFCNEKFNITIDLKPGQDKEKLIHHLENSGILTGDKHGHYKSKKWPEKIAEPYNPIEITRFILNNNSKDFSEKMKDPSIIDSFITSLYPFTYDNNGEINIISDNIIDILKIAEIEWDDYETIKLNDKELQFLSPGQRSSAMLPLITLVEEAPLVIDQPEDNLDNRMIGKMLVEILAERKEKRQIIVATHNPNIVVSGDAEQVIVLDAISNSKGECCKKGSIDKEDIIQSVIEIMEGGKEAFETRRNRYRL